MRLPHVACFTLLLLAAAACESDPPTPIPHGDNDGNGTCPPPCSPDDGVPAPWNTLTWEYDEIDVGNPTLPAGIQSRMIRKPNGDIYVAYLKQQESLPRCNIAVFSGDLSTPVPHYDLRVARLRDGNATWDSPQTISFAALAIADPENADNYLGHPTSRFGVDATLDRFGNFVVVLAAGDGSLAQCGSTDVVMCTEAGTSWDCEAMARSSADCCTYDSVCDNPENCPPGECVDPNCTNAGPGDVGAWAAIGRADNGTLGIAFSDIHNFWDQDGHAHRGFEFTEGSGFGGIRPWSGLGNFAALEYHANLPVVAFTGYTRGGLGVLRRISQVFDGYDWVEPVAPDNNPNSNIIDDWADFEVGERIRLEKAPDGDLGVLFHVAKNGSGTRIDDLVYCTSSNGGETWGFPCQKLVAGYVGAYPGLAFDAESVPYVVYRFCGTQECPASQDGVRMAWFDDSSAYGKWWRFDVHNTADSRSGAYNQIVVNPDTGEPTVAFQNVSRGSLVIARGSFGP